MFFFLSALKTPSKLANSRVFYMREVQINKKEQGKTSLKNFGSRFHTAFSKNFTPYAEFIFCKFH